MVETVVESGQRFLRCYRYYTRRAVLDAVACNYFLLRTRRDCRQCGTPPVGAMFLIANYAIYTWARGLNDSKIINFYPHGHRA